MLEKLKEYKDIIAIIVFFLGGFIWIEKEFPNKSDLQSEIGSVNCLLDKYMTLTQLQIRGQVLGKQVQDLTNELSRSVPNDGNANTPPLSPAMMFEHDQLNEELVAKRDRLRNNNDEMENISNELARNVCRKVK